jgi:hypothetical protein
MAVGLAGCALLSVPSSALVARGDRLAQQGDYAGAVQAYDEVIAKYPDDGVAPRVRVSREAMAGLLAARADVVKLRETLAAREGELARVRQDLQKVTAEAERLRADLEQLKQIDLRQERKRR